MRCLNFLRQGLTVFEAVWSGRDLQTFRMNLLLLRILKRLPKDESSASPLNVGKFVPDYTASQVRIWHICVCVYMCVCVYIKVKVKCSRYRLGMAQRVGRGIALLFHDRGTRRGEWSAACPSRTLPPGKILYPFYRRLGGPQGRSGREENLVPTGIRSRTLQPVAQSPIPTELPGAQKR